MTLVYHSTSFHVRITISSDLCIFWWGPHILYLPVTWREKNDIMSVRTSTYSSLNLNSPIHWVDIVQKSALRTCMCMITMQWAFPRVVCRINWFFGLDQIISRNCVHIAPFLASLAISARRCIVPVYGGGFSLLDSYGCDTRPGDSGVICGHTLMPTLTYLLGDALSYIKCMQYAP